MTTQERTVSHYGDRSSDGIDDQLWCVDGKVHVRAMRETGRDALANQHIAARHPGDEFERLLNELDDGILADDPATWERIHAAEWWNIGRSHHADGACDGSCRPGSQTLNLGARVTAMREELFCDGEIVVEDGKAVGCSGPILPSTVELDPGAQALVEAGTVTGRQLSSWYGKRSGEGETWCLGDRHLKISTEYDWWSGADNGTYKSHRLTVMPCDGSCRPKPVALTEQAAQALAALMSETQEDR